MSELISIPDPSTLPPLLPAYLPHHPLVSGGNTFINRFICRMVDDHMYALMDLDIPAHRASFVCVRCSRTLISSFPASSIFHTPQAHQE